MGLDIKGMATGAAKNALGKKKKSPNAKAGTSAYDSTSSKKSLANYGDGTEKYSFDNTHQYRAIQWPADIGTIYAGEEIPRIPHVVAFFINANGRSEDARDIEKKSKQADYDADYTNRWTRSAIDLKEQLRGASIDRPNFVASGIGEKEDKNDYNARIAVEKEDFEKENRLQIMASDAFEKMKSLIAPPKRRLRETIVLPMPLELSYSDQIAYGDAGIGGALGTALKGIGSGDITGALMNTGVAGGIEAIKLGISKLDGGPLGIKDGAKVFDKAIGAVINPRLEQIYENTGFREFTFNWQMAAKSETDADNIREIILRFRKNMYPEKADAISSDVGSGSFLVMPNEFDIVFYTLFKDEKATEEKSQKVVFVENNFIPKIISCVLTACSTNYTPQGFFSAFKNGAAPVVTLSLSFREVEPLHRKLIDNYGF